MNLKRIFKKWVKYSEKYKEGYLNLGKKKRVILKMRSKYKY